MPRSQPSWGTGRGRQAREGLGSRRCGSLGLSTLTEPEDAVTGGPTPSAGGKGLTEPLGGVARAEPIAGLVAATLNLSPPAWLSRSILGFRGHCPPHLQSSAPVRRQSRDSGHRHARGAWDEAKLTQASASAFGNGLSNRVSRGSGESLWRKG